MVCCSCLSAETIPPGLAVNLFGVDHRFLHEDPCPRELYDHMLGGRGVDGKEYDWTYNVSFDMMLKHCNIRKDLEQKYPRLTTFQLFKNWAILLLGLVFFLVPGLYYLVLLSQTGDTTEPAAMLMAKRAYDLERIVMQSEGPHMKDKTKMKIRIIVHHLVCAYYQRYVDISNQNNPFTTFFQYRTLYYPDSFLSDNVDHYLQTYGWVNDRDLKARVLEKALAALSRRMPGRTTSMLALAAVLFSVYVLLLVGMSYTGNRVLVIVGSVLLIIDIALTILYLGTWVPVTKRVVGLTTDTFTRWEEGRIHEDEIAGVTDLALLAIRYSEAEYRQEARVSEHKWIQLLHPSERPAKATEETDDSQTYHVHVNITNSRSNGSKSNTQLKSNQGTNTGSHRSRRPSDVRSSRSVPLAHHVHGPPPGFGGRTCAPSVGQHSQRVPHYAAPHAFAQPTPPVARNAENMGWTPAELAEAYERGYMQARRQQNVQGGHAPNLV